MYLSALQIVRSINGLDRVHPFHGITFLACKRKKLPVGQRTTFALDFETDNFLKEHHRISPASQWFFQPFKSSDRTKKWVRPDYAAKGLQAINTQTFGRAFLHDPGSRVWGWAPDYIRTLTGRLPRKLKIPTFDLSVWLFRDSDWPETTTNTHVIDRFLKEFFITREEQRELFDLAVPTEPRPNELFAQSRTSWRELKSLLPAPPDALPEEGGILVDLHLRNVGPVVDASFLPAESVSVVTGDNGLGKTFLLECCWWALTGQWAERQALPHEPRRPASIDFSIGGKGDFVARESIRFDQSSFHWPSPDERPTIPGLIVYARVDGSFAVWDPARHFDDQPHSAEPGFFLFTRDEVLNGVVTKIEGLIRDWVRWQNLKDQALFSLFSAVLGRLSPPDMAPLTPGESIRVPRDARDIPTLLHDYGKVPFINESAGVRRIVTIAYLLVWAWNEHRVQTNFSGKKPQDHIVLMIDEIEAHLHPKWQRTILPALLDVTGLLSDQMKPQIIIATHSPLILASMENTFSEERDKLFHLYLTTDSGKPQQVKLDEIRYFKHGTVDAWLTSDIFELRQARSREGEAALERAQNLLAESSSSKKGILEVDSALRRALPAEDPFWPRWLHFTRMKGIKL